MINTGCKYPGTPEPCEGYREILERSEEVGRANIDEIDRLTALIRQYEEDMEVLAEVEKSFIEIADDIVSLNSGSDTLAEEIRDNRRIAKKALTRINRLKGIDQLREKE